MHAICAVVVVALACPLAYAETDPPRPWPGLFVAWLPTVEPPTVTTVQFDDRADELRLRAHCANGQAVFQYHSNRRYTCKADWFEPQPDMLRAGVTVAGPAAPSKPFGVFSLHPLPATRWHQRTSTRTERRALQAAVRTAPPQLHPPEEPLHLQDTTVLSRYHDRRLTLIVPGQKVLLYLDSDIYTQRYYVFVQQNGRIRYQGALAGKPIEFLDVDGDDVPEILTSVVCDGQCITLSGVAQGVRELANFWTP